ncbi:Eco57I restriction-modification methylase domain-containing protein [Pseudomonas chlororaphis]|uniref:Eco57I restriction-modification methylase domain-containing protein n=1 Tax=Pseudomonas chlororaphis TaxID=587753 RepID=UPI000F56BA60|nr:class I SAM-dependent methyltransferase [Pseudomonas chlororaphis]AZC84285.1 hypothetical protein C4K30_5195 [Pseudomonas chlororaphis subsp. piscium]
MHYHKTPQAVVKLARRHIPKAACKVLEPAVGEGALLEALYPSQLHKELTLVDIDHRRLDAIKAIYPDLSLINADFVNWSESKNVTGFDLIITNPPFSGRSENWIQFCDQKAPIEYVFFRRCVELLEKDGTLVAIVPDTLVNSSRLSNERAWIFSQGAITYAYQLPERIFDKIEGAFYLLVFKKGMRQKYVKLRSLTGQPEIKISNATLISTDYRLDHSFYRSTKNLNSFTPKHSTLLGEICIVGRGPIRSNYKLVGNHHSNSFSEGFWRSYTTHNDSNLCIAVKRVSRNAHLSFGLFQIKDIEKSTDCLVFIKARDNELLKILFYLRAVMTNEDGKSLLLKGSGAKFIQVNDLKNIPYIDISGMFPSEYENFITAYNSLDISSCLDIEKTVYSKLLWGESVITLRSTRNNITKNNEQLLNAI